MTPPKINPNPSLPPTLTCEAPPVSSPPKFTCEKPAGLETVVYVPEAGLASFGTLEDPTEKKLETHFQAPGSYNAGQFRDLTTWAPRLTPFLPARNRFPQSDTPPSFSEDPTQYGLPADWQPKVSQIQPGEKFVAATDEASGAQLLQSMREVQSDQSNWLRNVIALLNQVQSADLDMYNIAVNQGNNFRRFSEYAPKDKDKPLLPPNLTVQTNTTAFVHGEIRPVQGQKDSLITRWVIQYDKPLRDEKSKLSIQGFSAVDAPNIEYDPRFGEWQAVRDISGGDLDYENPLKTGAPLKTDFFSVAPPLPEGHRDWMIAFNPIEDSVVASVKAAGGFGKLDFIADTPLLRFLKKSIDGGRGKLYLWAFNPTMGMVPQFNRKACEELRENNTAEKDLPLHCKIRPNTLPRKPSELVEFFSPLLDKYRNGLLRHASPYYNPNSEYIAPFIERGEKLLAWAKKKLGRDYSQPQEACKDLKGRWKEESCILDQPKSYREILNVNEDRTKECCDAMGGKWQKNNEVDSCILPYPKVFNPEQCEAPLIGRQPIPHEYSRAEKIDQELARLGLPRLPRRRGSIIDWFSSDLQHDPERLRDMKDKPRVEAHFRMNPGRLALSYGDVEIDAKTDLKVEYYADAVRVPDLEKPGQYKWEAQLGLKVTLSPLKLAKTKLKVGGWSLKADSLGAKELRVEIPNLLGMNETQPQTRKPITATIVGGMATKLHLTNQQGDVDVAMQKGTLEKLEFHFDRPSLLFGSDETKRHDRLARLMTLNPDPSCIDENNPNEPQWAATFTGLKGTGLKVGVPQIQGIDVAEFTIPTLEVGQRFKSSETETVSDILTVDIPELNSKGSVDLNLKEKDAVEDAKMEGSEEDEKKSKGNSVHLEGNSVLKAVHLTSQFMGDHSLLKGSFELSGIIDRATLTKEELGEISFTTKTNGHKVKPMSGNIKLEINNPSKGPNQAERPKGPPPKFDVNLDLPYVGLESKGAFTIPPGSATIRNGVVKIQSEDKISGNIEGELNLKDASYQHQKKPLEMGRLDMIPALKEGYAQGYFNFEIFKDGFRLSNPFQNPKDKEHYQPKDEEHPPLSMGFKLDGTQLHHCPTLPDGIPTPPDGKSLDTNFQINSSEVEVQNLGAFEIRSLTVEGETKPTLKDMESGPLFIRHFEGGGRMIMNLFPIGFEVLSFPELGGPITAEESYLPDARALTAGLPEERREKIQQEMAGGDYLYTAGLTFNRYKGGWGVSARDVILNLHEKGGLKQWAMIRFPQITFGMIEDKLLPINYYDYLANTKIILPSHHSKANLNTPERWRQALKKLKE